MKTRFLILLLMFSTSANADGESGKNAEPQNTKKGDTIWIEEKVTPTTTWIENLVKPLTVWMEQQVNRPEQKDDSQVDEQGNNQSNNQENTLLSTQSYSENILDPNLLIGSKKASILAKDHIAGDVLYIKLISKSTLYRVKLISELGEIHIIYIHAISGEIIPPNIKEPKKSVNPVSAKPNNDNQKDP